MPRYEKLKFWLVTVFLLLVLVGAVVGVVTLGVPLGQAVGPRDFTQQHRSGLTVLAGAREDDRLEVLAAWADGFAKRLAERYGVEPPTVTIRLLPGKRAFRAYGKRYIRGFHDHVDFCYSRREQVIYGYLTSSELVKRRLRHEIMHRLVHQRLPRLPLWLDEGLAELAEGLEVDAAGADLRLGEVQKEHLRIAAVLAEDEDINPGKLATSTGREFSGRDLRSWYGTAYAVALVLERQERLGDVLDAGEALLAHRDYRTFVADQDLWQAEALADSGADPNWRLPTVR